MDTDYQLGLFKGEFFSLDFSNIQAKSKSWSYMGMQSCELDGDF